MLILSTIVLYGQNSNVFLDRTYWKDNPSIAQIDQKIAEGNAISELSPYAFDAVCWALIEKTDNTTIKYLLTKEGNDVNKKTHDGRTYIFWAAYRGNLDMMTYLLNKGARTDIIDSHGYSLLNFAAITGQLDTKLYDFCIDNGADITTEKNHSGANALLLIAPFLKDIKLINYFTSKGLDIHDKDHFGNGIFNYATKKGNIELLKTLIQTGVSYKTLNEEGGNAMFFAAGGTRGHSNTLELYHFLESLGINPNTTTKNGTTPLHSIAYRNKDISIFKYFLSKKVNPNQVNEDGNTALINASYSNSKEVISLLVKHTKNINHKNKDGKSALTNAVNRNQPSIVAYLIENGADVHVTDKYNNNLAALLFKSYTSKKQKDFDEKIQLLQAKGLKVNAPQNNGNSLYHIAAETNKLNTVKLAHKYLKNHEVNTKNHQGMTPLHIAVMKAKDAAIIKFLLSIGADKTITTDFDETVYDLAKENELLEANNVDISFLEYKIQQ